MLQHEGLRAGLKGVGPKLLTVSPKLALGMTIAQTFIKEVESGIQKFGVFSVSKKQEEQQKPTEQDSFDLEYRR